MQANLNETPFIQITALPHDQVVSAQHPDLEVAQLAVAPQRVVVQVQLIEAHSLLLTSYGLETAQVNR